ncbi:MAG: L-lactate permease [Syntrophaceae bacterium]|nr:L-lactate permease [Syntrophaceae bacterium]
MDSLTPGLLGTLPLVLLFAGLTVTRVKSHFVTLAGLALTAGLALSVWEMVPAKLGASALEGGVIALVPIVWVILAAVFTYFAGVESGAMETVRETLVTLSPDRNVQAVIIAYCFGGFLEGVAGFGTAVTIPTAVLITMGFEPIRAAVIALVANSVPVAFGALGIPVIVLAQITGLDLPLLTRFVALQLLPFSILVPLVLALIGNGGARGLGPSLPEVFFLGIVFGAVQTATAFWLGPELVAVTGSLGSLAAYIAWKSAAGAWRLTGDRARLLTALSAYIVLLALVVATRVLPLDFLKHPPFTILLPLGASPVRIDWVTTPGTLLFVSAVAGSLLQGLTPARIARVFVQCLDRIKWSAWTIVNIVALAKIMGASGMVASTASMLAALSGKAYPLIAPGLGAIGTFVTGSDTASNILLGELQRETAKRIGADVHWIAASNTSGATAGKMISPQSISVAAATVGLQSEERAIVRTTLLYCAAYSAVMGLLVFAVNLLLTR